MIWGVSVNAAKSGLRGTLLPSDVIGVSFRETSRSLVCSSSCTPQATRRRTRYVVVCLLYEPVTIIHSLLLTTRLLRHSCVPWNAFQFDTQDKGGHSSAKGFQVSHHHNTRCAHAPSTYILPPRLRTRHGDHCAPAVQRLEGRALVVPSRNTRRKTVRYTEHQPVQNLVVRLPHA
jgi:hypothetical protein